MLKKTSLYAAYSTRKIVAEYAKQPLSLTEDQSLAPKDLAFGSNQWLSDREVNHDNTSSNHVALWYDQVGSNDLAPVAQQAPRFTSRQAQKLVHHKPVATFTDKTGLTATNPVTNFLDVALSFVISTDVVTASSVFNFTGVNDPRFQSHLPWIDGNVCFDFATVSSAAWRTSAAYPVIEGDFAIVTYVSSKDAASIYVNGKMLSTTVQTTEVIKSEKFILGFGNGIACASGNFSLGELVISKADYFKDVIKSQAKYFNIPVA